MYLAAVPAVLVPALVVADQLLELVAKMIAVAAAVVVVPLCFG